MKKSYSVLAWEDETHPAQFYIENVKEFETAQVIYNALCCDPRWLMVSMRMDVKYTDCQVEESGQIAEFERS